MPRESYRHAAIFVSSGTSSGSAKTPPTVGKSKFTQKHEKYKNEDKTIMPMSGCDLGVIRDVTGKSQNAAHRQEVVVYPKQ